MSVHLGKIGVWTGELRFGEEAFARETAAELETLGYGAIWMPGGVGGNILDAMTRALSGTRNIAIGSGVINIWKHEPKELGDWWRAQTPAHQARAMLGVGISHGPLVGESYAAPLTNTRKFLDALDAENIKREHLCIGALGPKMLALSGERTAGAHPYFMPAAHTAWAREILGAGPLLAPEQKVIPLRDAQKARSLARETMGYYLNLPNYVRGWLSVGFSEDEVRGMSDRVIDALFAWGEPDEIKARIEEHYAAGADHVCIQVMGVQGQDLIKAWRELAQALL